MVRTRRALISVGRIVALLAILATLGVWGASPAIAADPMVTPVVTVKDAGNGIAQIVVSVKNPTGKFIYWMDVISEIPAGMAFKGGLPDNVKFNGLNAMWSGKVNNAKAITGDYTYFVDTKGQTGDFSTGIKYIQMEAWGGVQMWNWTETSIEDGDIAPAAAPAAAAAAPAAAAAAAPAAAAPMVTPVVKTEAMSNGWTRVVVSVKNPTGRFIYWMDVLSEVPAGMTFKGGLPDNVKFDGFKAMWSGKVNNAKAITGDYTYYVATNGLSDSFATGIKYILMGPNGVNGQQMWAWTETDIE